MQVDTLTKKNPCPVAHMRTRRASRSRLGSVGEERLFTVLYALIEAGRLPTLHVEGLLFQRVSRGVRVTVNSALSGAVKV
ncbi:hypothetical protein VTN96DRAFT_3782 [Rasamsonia emersonii]